MTGNAFGSITTCGTYNFINGGNATDKPSQITNQYAHGILKVDSSFYSAQDGYRINQLLYVYMFDSSQTTAVFLRDVVDEVYVAVLGVLAP